jgi:hypothetical protein
MRPVDGDGPSGRNTGAGGLGRVVMRSGERP